MNKTRFLYKTVPIDKTDAINQRCDELESMRAQVAQLLKDMRDLDSSPLPTTHQVQILLKPGDEGYEDAPYEFDYIQYQGDVTWQNIENSTPLKLE
jgi:hypothetical protein